MNIISRLSMASLLMTAASVGCNAQVAEFGVRGGVSKIQGSNLGSGYSLDDGWRLGFSMTLNSWNHFGHEFGYGYNRTRLFQSGQDLGGMAIHQGFYDFIVYPTPEGSKIRPFVAGGGQFSNFVPPGASATQGQGSNKFGVNYGAGIKARVSERWLVRFDVRQYLSGKPFQGDLTSPAGGSLRQNEISVGFSWTL